MKKEKTIIIQYQEFDSWDEIDPQDVNLLQKAIDVCEEAYAPYSKFNVGASVLLNNGAVVVGSNQENIAYPSGMCAERVALFSASANYPQIDIDTLAIYAKQSIDKDEQLSPCGACRQVMQEYEHKQNQPIRVLLMNATNKVWQFQSCIDLLPLAFQFSFEKSNKN